MLIVNNKVQQLIAAIAETTSCLHSDKFGHALWQLFASLAPVDDMAVIAFPKKSRPYLIYGKTKKNIFFQNNDLANYVDGAYLLDPFFLATLENKATGFYHLKDIASDNFYTSEYFSQYYRFSVLRDEVGYLITLADGAYLHVSLACSSKYQTEELAVLGSITCWLAAILEKQWFDLFNQSKQQGEETSIHEQLTIAFQHFGRSLLTDRECEVARLLLQGHSTKSMATRLNVGIETIKVHRRNLYPKLDISSQPELFSLFLEALALVDSDTEVDPLIAYHSKVDRSL